MSTCWGSKFVVSILAGPPPPRHPILPASDDDIVPWDCDTEDPSRAAPAPPLTWQSLVAWYTVTVHVRQCITIPPPL